MVKAVFAGTAPAGPASARVAQVAPPRVPIPTPTSIWPRLTFTQGVLLGQLSMVILAVLFLRYVVFEDPDQAKRDSDRRLSKGTVADDEPRKKRRRARAPTNQSLAASTNGPPSIPSDTATSILNTLAYDLSSHPRESLDWLNVLTAQLLSSYRFLASNHLDGGARGLIEEALNRKVRPPSPTGTGGGGDADQGGSAGLIGLDEIEVDEVDLGQGFPQLSDARVRPSGHDGEGLRVEVDLDYTDKVALSLTTRVVVNFPRPRFAVLPVSLSLTLQRFSGTVTIELPTPSVSTGSSPSDAELPAPSVTEQLPLPPPPHEHPSIHLSLHPDFTLDLSTSSLLGSRAKLEDVPKVEQLLNARIRSIIQDRVVWPGRVEISLPGIRPHSHHHHHHHHHRSSSADDDFVGGGGTGAPATAAEAVDDWTVVDRPHPLACPNENLPPSFSLSDFKHREADSDDDNDDDLRAGRPTSSSSPLNHRRANVAGGMSSSTPPPLTLSRGDDLLTGSSLLGASLAARKATEDAIDTSSSSSRGTSSNPRSRDTPSIDFADPSGPSLSLHPKIRKRSSQQLPAPQLTTAAGAPPLRNAAPRTELNLENLRYLDQSFNHDNNSNNNPKNATKAAGGDATRRGATGGRRPASPTESFPGYFPASANSGPRSARGAGLGTAVGFNSAGGTRYRGVGGVGLSSR